MCWVFAAVRRLSLVAALGLLVAVASLVSDGAQALGLDGSVVVAHKSSCPEAYGIFPDQGSNLSPSYSQLLDQKDSSVLGSFFFFLFLSFFFF